MATLQRKKNKFYRSREHLTYEEVTALATAAGRRGRHPLRDQAIIWLSFRHGLRAGEAANLKWQSVTGWDTLFIQRLKGSSSGAHTLKPDEVEMLRDLRSRYPDSPYLFPNERGGAITPAAIGKMITRAAELAGLNIDVHPHMLRHACGYDLANQGIDTRMIQEWLGHVNIQHTSRYTAIAPLRFQSLPWKEFQPVPLDDCNL